MTALLITIACLTAAPICVNAADDEMPLVYRILPVFAWLIAWAVVVIMGVNQ